MFPYTLRILIKEIHHGKSDVSSAEITAYMWAAPELSHDHISHHLVSADGITKFRVCGWF